MTTADDLAPLLAIMSARIRRQVEARHEADRIVRERLELEAALRRYGAAGPTIAEACRADDAGRLDASIHATVSERVDREVRRQTRFRRSRDPRYDINRHIVVARLKRWLAGAGEWVRPSSFQADRTRGNVAATANRGCGPAAPKNRRPRRSRPRPKPGNRSALRPKSNAGG